MSRRERLLQDFEYARETFEKYNEDLNKKERYISEFFFDEETITFNLKLQKKKIPLTISVADYPGSCMLYTSDDCVSYTGPILKVLISIIKDQSTKIDIPCPNLPIIDVDIEEVNDDDDDDDTFDDDFDEDEDEWGSEEWFSEEDELGLEGPLVRSELLEKDMELFKKKYGENSITTRDFSSIDTLDVNLSIDVGWLDHSVADAWGVDPYLPITSRLSLSPSMYLRAMKPPKVELFQVEREHFGLKSQLTKISEKFVSDVWREEDTGLRSSGSSLRRSRGKKERKNKKNKSKTKKEEITVDPSRDKEVAMLIEMGFPYELSRNAVALTTNIDEATTLLLNSPDSCNTKSALKKLRKGKKSIGKGRGGRGGGGGEEERGIISKRLDLGDWAEHERMGELARMKHPPRTHGFLVQYADYLLQRIPTLSNYCVICDKTHVFANSAMLKPAVCSRELCCFAFQKLGVMSDAAEDIATEAEVVDLLVCMAKAAAKSSRKDVIFDPFPTLLDPSNSKKVILSPKKKDFSKLQSILSSFPPVRSLSQASDCIDMKSRLERSNRLAYPLLQWLISSNRSHIVKLQKSKHIPTMKTEFQFVLLSSPPEKEKRFRELREEHGSTFAFHGSSVENWHSILRNGLYNASGTKFQVNGAAHGKGIYLAPNASTSLGYCRMTGTHKKGKGSLDDGRFLESDNFYCMALCEVIDKDIKKSGGIWVSPSSEYVVTRFFFVYETGSIGCSANTQEDRFRAEITHALSP